MKILYCGTKVRVLEFGCRSVRSHCVYTLACTFTLVQFVFVSLAKGFPVVHPTQCTISLLTTVLHA